MVIYTRMGQVKMHRFLSETIFFLEAVNSDKSSDPNVNNTHSQSSVSFSPTNLSPSLTLYRKLHRQ